MIDDSVISAASHKAFLRALETDRSREYFVVYLGKMPVAALSFISLGQPDVTWGCYIGTEKMVPGLFVALFIIATDHVFAKPETSALCSEIVSDNMAPIKFNRFLGLKTTGSYKRTASSGSEIELCCYRLERPRLAEIKAKAFTAMPSSMKLAYKHWNTEN
ncbi:hypothetical protein [Marinobacter sp. LV10MA510-1]|uniref:hypothetical protein n=1 Tax=Marinobacter sp. LV10MA510-1 TaxID=1415567 RepID=UPI00117DE64A|nr:hypothetical protein [Marinobacter sp. LV10MA510-1]